MLNLKGVQWSWWSWRVAELTEWRYFKYTEGRSHTESGGEINQKW